MSDLPLFGQIFGLYEIAKSRGRVAEFARDMGVTTPCANQWVRRGWVAPWHWPQLVGMLAAKWGRTVTYKQLVDATVQLRKDGVLTHARKSAQTRISRRIGDSNGANAGNF